MTIRSTPVNEAVLEINVTEFKAKCLALFKELEARRYDKVVVTRRGKAIAELTPAVRLRCQISTAACRARAIIPPELDLTDPVLEDIPEAESGEGPFF